jgi:hypothetical protein
LIENYLRGLQNGQFLCSKVKQTNNILTQFLTRFPLDLLETLIDPQPVAAQAAAQLGTLHLNQTLSRCLIEYQLGVLQNGQFLM